LVGTGDKAYERLVNYQPTRPIISTSSLIVLCLTSRCGSLSLLSVRHVIQSVSLHPLSLPSLRQERPRTASVIDPTQIRNNYSAINTSDPSYRRQQQYQYARDHGCADRACHDYHWRDRAILRAQIFSSHVNRRLTYRYRH
jgi:hypothetical protein